ncbi:MAG: sodium:proton antiporter [Alistipes sp.]|nr:sodium:proton antiporter [Alistipes sp.]
MQHVELWMLAPFCVMLLSIAVAPLVASEWWDKNRNKLIFTLLIAIPTAIMLVHYGLGEPLLHQIVGDYIPFIILLATLFVVTGGIKVHYSTTPTPLANSIMLLLGYCIASLVGTTGAAMLLIRPLLDINRQRTHKWHTVVFFIAMVANCGGVLSPLGDPPLFLLYLRGATFDWFQSLYAQWAFVGGALLLIYFLWDTYVYKKKELMGVRPAAEDEEDEPITFSIKGGINALFLIATVAAVALLNPSVVPAMGEEDAPFWLRNLREVALCVVMALSLLLTGRSVRRENHFSWGPIVEVAIIFVGIFVTMTPAMIYLNDNASMLGITTPAQFFYSAGALSSFLDNAPTAVAFHTVASGLPAAAGVPIVAGISEALLKAISLGAVFFGAMTYIGNGPNFMVKAIAESEGVKMPSFFGYMFRFSLPVLLPVYMALQWVFF